MARSKQLARDRILPAAPETDQPGRAHGGGRRAGPALPQADGPLTAGGARRAAGAAGNDFVADLVGGKRGGGGGGGGGLQINANVSGGGASAQVSGGIQVGGLSIGGNLRIGGGRGNNGAGGQGGRGAEAGGRGAEAGGRGAEAGGRGADARATGPAQGGGGPAGPAGGAGPAGAGAARGGDTGGGAGGDDVVAVGGFSMRTAGGTAAGGANAPAGRPAAPNGGSAAGGGGSAAGAGGGAGGRGGRASGGRGGSSLTVSVGGVSATVSESGVSASASGSSGTASVSASRDGVAANASNGTASGSVRTGAGGTSASVAIGAGATSAGGSSGAAAPTTAAGASRAGGTTGAGATSRAGSGGSSGNAAGGARAPRGGSGGGGAGGAARGGAARAGGGGGGGGGRPAAAPVAVNNTESAQGAMNEFLGSTPTAQVKMWANVGGAVDTGIKKDGEAIQTAVPELHATMGGGGQQPAANEKKTDVKAGQGKIDDKKVSPDAPKLKPEPTVMPAPPRVVDGAAAMSGITAETPVEQKQAKAAETIRAMPTTMEGVPTSPGPAPSIPLTGDADPAKADVNRADAEAQARKGGDDLRAAVENGRGPDAVQPKVFDEVSKIRDITDAKVDATAETDPLRKFMQLGVPADVEAAIDEQQQAVMDTALGEARGKMDEAVSTKDTDSQAEIEAAETEAESLRNEAESGQQEAVGKARGEITDAREKTLADQAKAVAQLESEAGSKQKQEVDAIRARVSQDEAKIDSAYTKAETDVQKKIEEGEKDAEAEKKKAEEESNNRSWWDRVKDAVASAFKALTDAINSILNWVRDAVKGILDTVKKLATDLIDAASKWITDKLKAFGDWLKSQVTALLGSVFPELAAKLNEWIDAAVNYAVEKVEQFATALKEGITALCDKIAGALDAIIAIYQAAVNFAMALAEAALTGNWAKVGMIVLEGILKLAGIPPEEFYAVVGKAEDTIGTIVENPGGFLGNCIDAVGQGFGQFSDNFLDHLQTGFLSWMTGTMGDAGLTMPASFDLAGIFDLVMQVTGLTPEHLREKAVEHIGEENVERVEFVWGFIESALEGGWGGLFEHVEEHLGSLWDDVVGAIQNFLMEKIIKSAVLKIASMFNPVGAIVQAVMTAWNLYEFLRDQIQRIFGVVRAVVDSISDIANGNIGGAADMIENALGNLVPVAIDLLAKLLGLGGIGAKVKEVIKKVQAKVDSAIDKLIEKVKGLFTGGKKDKDKDKNAQDDAAAAPANGAAPAQPGAPDGTQPPDDKKPGATPNGTFDFQSGKLVGRDATLGAVTFQVAGSGRVKHDKGEPLTDGHIGHAKGDALQAATSAVGKAVNADGVTRVTPKLATLSSQAKASAARQLSGSGLTLEDLNITGIVLPPEVQQALDTRNAETATAVGLGEPLTFQAGAETHRLWVAPDGNGVAVMMASIPTKVSDKVQEIRAVVKDLPKDEKQKIGSLIGKAIAIERQLDKLGNEAKAAALPATGGAATGGKGKDFTAAIGAKQQDLAGALAELLMVMPEGAQKAAFDMDMSLKGANFQKFLGQYQDMFAQMGKSASTADAENIWRLLAKTLISTTEDFNKLRPDGKNIQWDLDTQILDKVLADFQPLVTALTPAMRELSSQSSTWAFWSGAPGKDAAVQNGVNALEASALGKAFDGVNMDGKWAMQLWGAMSKAYATFASEQIAGRTFIGFLGQVPRDQSIVMKIEQPAFRSITGEKFKATPSITFHSAAALPWQRDLADVATANGYKASYGAGSDMASAGSTAAAQNTARAEAYQRVIAAGVSEADAQAGSKGKNAAEIDALAARAKGQVGSGNTQTTTNGQVQVPPSTSGLTSPVGGGSSVGNQLGKGGGGAIAAANGDQKLENLHPVGLPTAEASGPGTTAGKRDGSGKVEDAGSLGVGDQGASEKKKESTENRTAVSKYAVADAPADWSTRVEKSVASETVNADDPGHTYHTLDNGDVVSQSKPMLVDSGTAAKTRKRIGFSPRSKKKSPEDTLRADTRMSAEEVDAMKGALKKNPRSEEVLQADGTKASVAKPDLTDATGKKISNGENADGTLRAPMTEKEKEALLKAHGILAEDNKEGADMRKVIPNASVGTFLSGDAEVGKRKLKTGGSVALARNTEGMNDEDTVATLGLDYTDPSVAKVSAPGYRSKKQISPFAEKDEKTGQVTMSDDVDKNGLHFIDFKMTKDMEKNAGVLMSQSLIDQAKGSNDASISKMGTQAIPREKETREDAYAGTGATSSNAMRRKRGPNAGAEFEPDVNQELKLNGGFDIQSGAQLKRRGEKPGQDKLIATLVEKADKDGKIVKEWELHQDLEKNEKGQYKNRTDKVEAEHRATVKLPGESDADHKKRLASRDGTIVAQQTEDMSDAAANGNPFEPGTAAFKSYNRKAKEKAKAKADSAEAKTVAPNGDTSAVPKVQDSPPVVSSAPPAAAAEDKVSKASVKSKPDTESAPVAQVEAAGKKDAKTPAEEVEKLLSPAAKVKPPKQSKPPKDFPEPANDTVQGTGTNTGTTTTTTDTTPKKVAANPGLRKEHEGTGVEYTEMKGEAFVKGEGDANDIDPNDVKQGSLGDCYLLGGMAAVSRANPEHIRKLIKDNGDGTYDVTLYIKDNAWSSKGTAKVVTVDGKFPSSDKGLTAKYAKAGDKGAKGPELWCMLIEKAWAVHKGTYTGIEGGHVNDDGKFGGAIALLTNLKEGYYTPSSIGDKQLAQMISDALTKKMPVACDSKNLDKEPPDLKAAADAAGVVGNHAYAPRSVDLTSMTIELQNPWGSSHVSGLKIADFKRFYRGLRIGS